MVRKWFAFMVNQIVGFDGEDQTLPKANRFDKMHSLERDH